MPGISTLLEQRQIRPHMTFFLLLYGCLFSFRRPFNAVAFVPFPFSVGSYPFRPFLMPRCFHDSGSSFSSMFASVKAPNHIYYIMHVAQPGHESAFGSICVPKWHEIEAPLNASTLEILLKKRMLSFAFE